MDERRGAARFPSIILLLRREVVPCKHSLVMPALISGEGVEFGDRPPAPCAAGQHDLDITG